MRVIDGHSGFPAGLRGAAVALGNFDGVHLGHRAVFERAIAEAKALGAPSGVVTFEPHPRSVLRPDLPPFRLTARPQKTRAIADIGLDMTVFLRFDPTLSDRTAEEFVRDVLARDLGVKAVVVGYDFRFGHDRAGGAATLAELGREHGFAVHVVEEVRCPGDGRISSTIIRQHLKDGRPAEAARLLGRWWEVEDEVCDGRRLGRTIGFPTANLRLGDLMPPALGVYAVRAGIADGETTQWHDAVANLGVRPTVDGQTLLLEVHLFDYAGDLYGQRLRVQFLSFLRPEQKFDGIDELKAQIGRDCEAARTVLARTGPNASPAAS